jgi:hypothetical protein
LVPPWTANYFDWGVKIMVLRSIAARALSAEARALLTRIDSLRPYALHMPMVTAAAISPAAQTAVESHMSMARRRLRSMVNQFIDWLHRPDGGEPAPAEAQRRFTLLRLRFNSIISQFDIFADVLAQRSEHETGVWIAGLDDLAADALELPGYYTAPPAICYLIRGPGAAIRRARTRLPGGDLTPVPIISVPRERMVGSGIASSVVHEVGHQAAALLDLTNSLRPALRGMQLKGGTERVAWTLWDRWIGEIVADFWALAKIGIGATTGLIGVVSLPRSFVFRVAMDDPHPFPWIRVKLSCAIGRALYPHPQWNAWDALWESFYPSYKLDQQKRRLLVVLQATLPAFVSLLVNHRPIALGGRSLTEVMPVADRQPARLAAHYRSWGGSPALMREVSPTLAFAVIGQARADGRINPEEESRIVGHLLTYWAMRSAMDISAICATQPMPWSRRARAIPKSSI